MRKKLFHQHNTILYVGIRITMKEDLINKVKKKSGLNVIDYQSNGSFLSLRGKNKDDKYIFFCNIESIKNILEIKNFELIIFDESLSIMY